jgi:hypothetical protein
MARRTLEKAALDLTPPTWAAATRGLRFRRRMLAAAACVGGVWLLGAMGILGGLFVQEQRLNGLKREQDRWRGPAMEVRATRRRVAMIRRYMDRRHSALECLREVSSLLPAGIDLTEFNYRKGESVNLQGKAGTVEQVYGFKRNVDGSGLFLGTRLNGPTTERKTGQQVFGMDMKLPPEESAGGGEAAAGGRAAAGGGA